MNDLSVDCFPSSLKELSPFSKFSVAHNHLVETIKLCNFMDIASFFYFEYTFQKISYIHADMNIKGGLHAADVDQACSM